MPINIRNPEVERLLRELRTTTGKGTTELVLDLVRKEVERQRRLCGLEDRRAQILALCERYQARLPPNPATPDEIIGYDDDGLPR